MSGGFGSKQQPARRASRAEENQMSTIGTPVRQEGETTDTARRPKQLLAAIALSYDLAEESEALIAEARTVSDGRAAKALSKHPGLNTVITALRQGLRCSDAYRGLLDDASTGLLTANHGRATCPE
jgi:hypothetical protein